MSGRKSRQKGYRGEYELVKLLKLQGLDAKRVPCSGSAAGFNGDIHVSNGSRNVVIEVKSRRDEFKSIYALFDRYEDEGLVFFTQDDDTLIISNNINNLGFFVNPTGMYHVFCSRDLTDEDKKSASKLFKLQKHVKESDMLAIKIDRKPYLFIRYLT
jgi:Holliday junction resolvase